MGMTGLDIIRGFDLWIILRQPAVAQPILTIIATFCDSDTTGNNVLLYCCRGPIF